MLPSLQDPFGSVPLRWFKDVPTALFILDRNGKLSYFNEAFVKMSGYTDEEITETSLDAMVGPESMHATLNGLLRIYEGRGLVRHQHEVVRKDGKRLRVTLDLTPVYGEGDESAKVVSVIGIVHDAQEL